MYAHNDAGQHTFETSLAVRIWLVSTETTLHILSFWVARTETNIKFHPLRTREKVGNLEAFGCISCLRHRCSTTALLAGVEKNLVELLH
jgi:hypothetical protein